MADDAVTGMDEAAGLAATTTCWRCGLEVELNAATCLHCAARFANASKTTAQPFTAAEAAAKSIKVLIWTYGLLLLTGIVHAGLASILIDSKRHIDDAARSLFLKQVLIAELIDTLVILVAWLIWPRISTRSASSWILAMAHQRWSVNRL